MLVGDIPAPRPNAVHPPLRKANEPPDNHALATISALRMLLTGESVIDLASFWLITDAQVDRFLRLSGFDTDNPLDLGRLWEIHGEAITYLTELHRYDLPRQVVQPERIHDLFLMASTGARRLRQGSCMTLKVMHIMNHIAGRELVFNTDISEAQLFDRLNGKVFTVIDRMRAAGISVPEFAAGTKSRNSQVTKLLAKRGNLASHIFDKLRFRLIVGSKDDLVRALVYLIEHLFPFNYVVPEQSSNGIITTEDIARVLELGVAEVDTHWGAPMHSPAVSSSSLPTNEFSGPGYHSVNFVVDIPLRVDDVAPRAAPAVVFVQAEIQVVDTETDQHNNEGDNAHRLYKERQRASVRSRLECKQAGHNGGSSENQDQDPS